MSRSRTSLRLITDVLTLIYDTVRIRSARRRSLRTVVGAPFGYLTAMADPKTEPTTDMTQADAANGEPDAMERVKPSVERALAGNEVRDDEVEYPTGEDQAAENRKNESPA